MWRGWVYSLVGRVLTTAVARGICEVLCCRCVGNFVEGSPLYPATTARPRIDLGFFLPREFLGGDAAPRSIRLIGTAPPRPQPIGVLVFPSDQRPDGTTEPNLILALKAAVTAVDVPPASCRRLSVISSGLGLRDNHPEGTRRIRRAMQLHSTRYTRKCRVQQQRAWIGAAELDAESGLPVEVTQRRTESTAVRSPDSCSE